jgi:hypothetical protein
MHVTDSSPRQAPGPAVRTAGLLTELWEDVDRHGEGPLRHQTARLGVQAGGVRDGDDLCGTDRYCAELRCGRWRVRIAPTGVGLQRRLDSARRWSGTRRSPRPGERQHQVLAYAQCHCRTVVGLVDVDDCTG